MIGHRARLCLILALSLTGTAQADAPLDRSFSSLCTEADSGDITGTRIKITGAAPDLGLSYEEPEGALVTATTTKDVTYAPATGALSFKLKTDTGQVSFEGHLSDTQLDGTLKREDGTEEALRLPLDKGGEGENACAGAAPPVAKPDVPEAKPDVPEAKP